MGYYCFKYVTVFEAMSKIMRCYDHSTEQQNKMNLEQSSQFGVSDLPAQALIYTLQMSGGASGICSDGTPITSAP